MILLKKETLEDGRVYVAGQPENVCSRVMEVILNGDVVEDARITGGCGGNTQGVTCLMKGMKVDDVIARIGGIDCGGRGTSCPDQLAQLLKESKNQ